MLGARTEYYKELKAKWRVANLEKIRKEKIAVNRNSKRNDLRMKVREMEKMIKKNNKGAEIPEIDFSKEVDHAKQEIEEYAA